MDKSKEGKVKNKMTIYFKEPEETKVIPPEEIEEDAKEVDSELAIRGGYAIMNLIWKLIVAPLVFMLLWNSILTNSFGAARIDYFKSLGILVMSAIALGKIEIDRE